MSNETLIKKICMLATIVVLACLISQNATAQETKTNQICAALYDSYKELGETKFSEKFGTKKNSKDCIGLYNNPNWNFKGKGKIDSFYEQKQSKKNTVKAETKIFGAKYIGNGNYLVKFNICTKDVRISQPIVLVESKSDKFLAVTYFAIQPNSCKSYQAQARASSENEFTVRFVNDLTDPEFKSIKIMKLKDR